MIFKSERKYMKIWRLTDWGKIEVKWGNIMLLDSFNKVDFGGDVVREERHT